MKNRLTREELRKLRKEYPAGARVELVKMNDVQAPPVGTQGTVQGVDDIGSVLVQWDNGSCLNIIYGEDECRKISEVFVYKRSNIFIIFQDVSSSCHCALCKNKMKAGEEEAMIICQNGQYFPNIHTHKKCYEEAVSESRIEMCHKIESQYEEYMQLKQIFE